MFRQSCLGLILLTCVGCAATAADPSPTGAGPDTGAPTDPGTGTGGSPSQLDPSATNPAQPEVVAVLSGKVWAPNGTVPIAGALVYLSAEKPAPIPDKVYCDSCVKITAGTPYALTDASGSFELSATSAGAQYLVLQKGGFRRVREIYVSKGTESLPGTLTSLPAKTDLAAGDEIPRITVVRGAYDEIEASLEKLGIDPSAIDLVESPLIGKAAKEFLSDASRVDDRHIVFLPCGDFTQPPPNVDLSAEPTIQDNLRDFVDAGGRLYVTDWHYDFIARTFPGFVEFAGASQTACSGCEHLSYDAAADVSDPDLAAWLAAQSLTSFTLQKNYTQITAVHPQSVEDASGGTTQVTPRTWVNGSKQGSAPRPATVSFEHGCGRVLFSTYHTEPFSLDLTPQERALLGVLLEVTVCNGSSEGVIVK